MQFAEALERAVLDALAAKYLKRKLDTNVEYYTALVLDGVGLPRELFTPAFAMGRVLDGVLISRSRSRVDASFG